MSSPVEFASNGLRLRGDLHVAANAAEGPRPGVVLCHGFGGSRAGAGQPQLATALQDAGYTVLRFDFRGCGESDGEPGRVIVAEEVEDTRHAVTFLMTCDGVDATRIGLFGASLGGTVAILAALDDARILACIANGSPSFGPRWLRDQHPDVASWRRLTAAVAEASRERVETGSSRMLDRFDIVYIPESQRAGLPPGARMSFPAETAESLLSIDVESVVARFAPRPLLLLHSQHDAVVPATESSSLAARAGGWCDLQLVDSTEHFSSGAPAVQRRVIDWFAAHL